MALVRPSGEIIHYTVDDDQSTGGHGYHSSFSIRKSAIEAGDVLLVAPYFGYIIHSTSGLVKYPNSITESYSGVFLFEQQPPQS